MYYMVHTREFGSTDQTINCLYLSVFEENKLRLSWNLRCRHNFGTCVLFRTHSISEVRSFCETNYDAGTFYEKIRFQSHKDKTQFSLLRIVIEDSVWTWILKWRFGICQRLKKWPLYFSRIRGCCSQQNSGSMDTTWLYTFTRRSIFGSVTIGRVWKVRLQFS